MLAYFWQGSGLTFYKIILLVSGVSFCVYGFFQFIKTKRNIQNSTSVNGVVTKIIDGIDTNGYQSYFPLIEYSDENSGKKCSYRSVNGYWKSKFKIGQNVGLLIRKTENEPEICINTKFDIWGLSVISISMGLIILLIGFYIMFK
jgi:hypothetical protein